jgi:YD repeat-containing protein
MLLLSTKISAQETFTPEAASIFKSIEAVPDLPHGADNISIPIYTLKGTNISLPISINYNTSGIRVSEYASSIGLGWNLSAGGVLGRSLGSYIPEPIPDEEIDTYIIKTKENMLMHGVTMAPLDYMDYSRLGRHYNDYFAEKWDIHPGDIDLFYYSIPNHSGKFYVDQNDKVWTIPYNPKIIIDLNNLTITDENGIVYSFSLDFKEIDYHGNSSFFYKRWNSLRLKRITDSRTGEWVSFSYELEKLDKRCFYLKPNYIECDNNSATKVTSFIPYYFNQRPFGFNNSKQYRLKTITTSWNTKVEFTPSNEERTDLLGAYAIKEIKVSNAYSSIEKKFKLYHSYFNCNGSSHDAKSYQYPYEKLAYSSCLRLDSIQEVGDEGGVIPPYEFDYFANPGRRGTLSRDRFGFYNGADNDRLNIAADFGRGCDISGGNIEPNIHYCKRGALKEYRVPTGGRYVYHYGINTYRKDGNQKNGAGLRIDKKEIIDEDGEKLIVDYLYDGGTIKNEPFNSYLQFYTYDLYQPAGAGRFVFSYHTYCHYTFPENGISAFCHGQTPKSVYSQVSTVNSNISNEKLGKTVYSYENVGGNTPFRFSFYGEETPRLQKKEIFGGSDGFDLLREEKYFHRQEHMNTGYGHKISLNEKIQWEVGEIIPSGIHHLTTLVQSKGYISNYSVVDSVVLIDYFPEGSMSTKKYFEYDDKNYVTKEVVDMGDKKVEIYSQRPFQFSQSNSTINKMINDNYISPVIEVVKTVNSTVTEGQFNKYEIDNNHVVLSESHRLKSTPAFTNFTFSTANARAFVKDDQYKLEESYNWLNGKLSEKIGEDGETTSYFWNSFNVNTPLLIGHNITRSKLYGLLGNSLAQLGIYDLGRFISYDVDGLNTKAKIDKLNELNRKINDQIGGTEQVSSIYSQPLIGVMGMTDANGVTTYYRYDEFGRLISILNRNFQIVESYKYNYGN